MTGTSTASVQICGECYTALNVVERAVILTALLYRNGMVGDDGSIGAFKPTMFEVVAMEDIESATGKTSRKVGLAATLTKSMNKLGFMEDGKLLAADELLALRYLPESGVTEIDIKALGLPAALVDELYHEKDKLHPNGPIFEGQSVVTLGCGHATPMAIPGEPTISKEEVVMPQELTLEDASVEAAASEHEVSAEADDSKPNLLAELDIKDADLLDPETAEKLVGVIEELRAQVGDLQDSLGAEQEKNKRLSNTNKVHLEQIELLRQRLAGFQISNELQERIMRALNRKSGPESQEAQS